MPAFSSASTVSSVLAVLLAASISSRTAPSAALMAAEATVSAFRAAASAAWAFCCRTSTCRCANLQSRSLRVAVLTAATGFASASSSVSPLIAPSGPQDACFSQDSCWPLLLEPSAAMRNAALR